MRFIVTKDYEELSHVMMHQMLRRMYGDDERINIAITTGRTPVDGYKLLAKEVCDKLGLITCTITSLTNFGFMIQRVARIFPTAK